MLLMDSVKSDLDLSLVCSVNIVPGLSHIGPSIISWNYSLLHRSFYDEMVIELYCSSFWNKANKSLKSITTVEKILDSSILSYRWFSRIALCSSATGKCNFFAICHEMFSFSKL